MSKVYEIVTEKILEALDKDIIPWKKSWDTPINKNPVSGTVYKGINVFLLNLSRIVNNYSSPYWYTFKQVSKNGGRIKKGEKSTLITFYNIKEKEKDLTEAEEKVFRDTGKLPKLFYLRYYLVFNHDQTEGLELPDKDKGKAFNSIACCEKVLRDYKDCPDIKYGFDPSYNKKDDIIRMPKKRDFENVEEYYSTIFHEMGHSTGHKKRLKRVCLENYTGESYAKEELIAEMAAAFLCGHCSISSSVIENQAAYVKGWKKKIKEDKYLVTHAAGAAQKAADYILNV